MGSGALASVACQPLPAPEIPAKPLAGRHAVKAGGFELEAAPSPTGELGAGYRLKPPGAAAHAVHLLPLLEVDGSAPRTKHIRTDTSSDALTFVQRSAQCEITSVARLASGGMLELTLRTTCQAKHEVRVGWRVDWPGRQSFLPGLGFASRGRGSASWVGRQLETGAIALAAKARSSIQLVADHAGHLGAESWTDTKKLDASTRIEERHKLILTAGPLADAARMAWEFAGQPLGSVHGSLEPAPEWAVIEARDEAGQLVVSSRVTKDGHWRLSLPPGNYTVRSRSPGGSDGLTTLVTIGGDATLRLVPPTPGQLELLAVDSEGAPLATRWILRGVGETPDPMLSAQTQLNAGMVFALRGTGRVSLPPGQYRVTATHGPEYGLFQQDVHIESGKGAVVRARLSRQLEVPGWVPSDFHLHQAPSFDSEVKLEDRLTALLADGIRFAAATDHNVVTDYSQALAALAPDAELGTIPGVEVTTRDWGHFNAFPYGIKDPPTTKERTPKQIFHQIRQDQPSAVVQVNHPRMGDIGYFNRGKLDLKTGDAEPGFSYDFDTIEVLNGFDLGNPWAVQQCLESWYGLLENGWRFTGVGNSDSHKLVGEYAGYPRTYVGVPAGAPVTVEAITASLKSGRAWVSNGPKLLVSLNGVGPGGQTSISAGKYLEVEVGTADFVSVNRLELVVNGVRVVEQRFPEEIRGGTRQLKIPLELVEDSWVVVLVRGDEALESILPKIDAKPLAFSNPIYVDVDGDGKFRARRTKVREQQERAAASGSSVGD